jgi:hypothetical protein
MVPLGKGMNMNRRAAVNTKFLIAAAAILVVTVMTIVFYPSSNVQHSETSKTLLNEDGTVAGSDSKSTEEKSGEAYLGKTAAGAGIDTAVIPENVRGKTPEEISETLKKTKNAKVAMWGKSDSAEELKVKEVEGMKLKEKPKKIGSCFLAKFKLKKGNVNRRIKLDTDSLNKKSVCVRVDGAPVKHKVSKGGDILIGAIGESKDLTVRYCVDGWNCSESCKVADDDFMAAIGGLGGSLGGSNSDDTGFAENGNLNGDEKKLDKEISGLRKQIAALRKNQGKKTISLKASKETRTCESRLVKKKSLTAKR